MQKSNTLPVDFSFSLHMPLVFKLENKYINTYSVAWISPRSGWAGGAWWALSIKTETWSNETMASFLQFFKLRYEKKKPLGGILRYIFNDINDWCVWYFQRNYDVTNFCNTALFENIFTLKKYRHKSTNGGIGRLKWQRPFTKGKKTSTSPSLFKQ